MNNRRYFAILVFLVFCGFIAWLFADILVYMFLALVLTILGSPLMKLLSKIRMRNWTFPRSMAAVVTIMVELGLLFSLFYFIMPLIFNEFQALVNLDYETMSYSVHQWLMEADAWLRNKRLLTTQDNLSTIVVQQISSMFQDMSISSLFGSTLSMISTLFVGIFSVVFMLFFSLKDNKIFFKMLRKLIPTAYKENYDHILNATIQQVSRYFLGVSLEMLIMGVLECIGCKLFQVPNAMLIGFMGGLLNVIPYVGPLIAAGMSVVFAVAGMISAGAVSNVILWTIIKVVAVFVVCKMIDDFVLQPIIYGKSVQAHPLEIFVVILVAAHLGGVLGMIFAVPVYSLIRIIIKELFGALYTNEQSENTGVSK